MELNVDLFNELICPTIILSTRWHKHLGVIENIDKSTISSGTKLNSANEFSFDIHKKLDNHECVLWNDIVDLKFIYLPDRDEYFEITVSIDESDSTIKHITATAACEAELDQRLLRNFEVNTESDITNKDYKVTTFYNGFEPKASLLHRVLADKCPDYKIIHVDPTLSNIQRTFSTDGTGVYSFLTNDVASEVGCLFKFDSVNRGISAYDLKCNCNACGYRGEWEGSCPNILLKTTGIRVYDVKIKEEQDITQVFWGYAQNNILNYDFIIKYIDSKVEIRFYKDDYSYSTYKYRSDRIPKGLYFKKIMLYSTSTLVSTDIDFEIDGYDNHVCGSTDVTYGYGKNTNIFISAENFATSLTIDGAADQVKNCFLIQGGDESINAAVRNINPNGSGYIYRFNEETLRDMPPELVQKINSYNEEYEKYQPEYKNLAQLRYDAIDNYYYYKTKMMPGIEIPVTTAKQECEKAVAWFTTSGNYVDVSNAVTNLSDNSANSAVKGMCKVLINANYDVEIVNSLTPTPIGSSKVWHGAIKVKNLGDTKDTPEDKRDDYTSTLFDVTITGDNYETYLEQKIKKQLDRKDIEFTEIFKIEDDDEFKKELTKYSLDSLVGSNYPTGTPGGFASSYQAVLEVLTEQGVTSTNKDFYGVDLYTTMYVPYKNRYDWIIAEATIRQKTVDSYSALIKEYAEKQEEIQKKLNFKTYIGDDLWKIYSHYRREDTYSNDNYISDGLDNAEILSKAEELFETAQDEIFKASELQLTLSSSLNDLLLHKEFKDFRQYIEVGNWITCRVDNQNYRLRISEIQLDYGNPENINITFTNVTKNKNYISDLESIINAASSMASSYDYVSHQATQGNEAAQTIDTYRQYGLNAALYNIVNADNQNVTFDEHGLSCMQYDDVINDYSKEQVKIINNCIAFTKDGWDTVSSALGKLKYKLDGVEYEDYGLNADTVIGGKVISGDIYSANYSSKNNTGAHFDLQNGTFTFANGKLTYNSSSDNLVYKGAFTILDRNSLTLFNADPVNYTVSIAGFTVKNNALYLGTNSIESETSGVYVGIDGIRNYKDSNHSVTIKNGEIIANAGNIAGWNIKHTTDDGYYLGTDNDFIKISSKTGLNFNNKFVVNPSGSFSATEGNIAGWIVSPKYIFNYFNGAEDTSHYVELCNGTDSGNNFILVQEGVHQPFYVKRDGTMHATKGDIGGCSIVNGVLKIKSANIESIDASTITTGELNANLIKQGGIAIDKLYTTQTSTGAYYDFDKSVKSTSFQLSINSTTNVTINNSGFVRTRTGESQPTTVTWDKFFSWA